MQIDKEMVAIYANVLAEASWDAKERMKALKKLEAAGENAVTREKALVAKKQ